MWRRLTAAPKDFDHAHYLKLYVVVLIACASLVVFALLDRFWPLLTFGLLLLVIVTSRLGRGLEQRASAGQK